MPSLFEPQVAQDIIARINRLQPTTQSKWGKMNVAQMLFHCNQALGTATGEVTTKTSFLFKLMRPMIKKMVMSEKPYKAGLPTAKEFIILDAKNFEIEKTNILSRLNKFISNGTITVVGKEHPAFGKLTAYEWGFSQWKHFDHHLKQFGV